jgi:hypothetical protein
LQRVATWRDFNWNNSKKKSNNTMNRIAAFLIVAFLAVATQATKAQTATGWNERDLFFAVLDEAYNASKENNIELVRQRTGALYERAKLWRKSTPASGAWPKAAKKEMKKLVKLSKQLDKLVRNNAADADIKQKIAHVHKVYEDVAAAGV